MNAVENLRWQIEDLRHSIEEAIKRLTEAQRFLEKVKDSVDDSAWENG